MAKVEISSPPTSPYGAGQLQLQNRVQMTSTLTPVTDDLNTTSPLKLSTNLVQVVSTLRITTADNPYIDAEDSAGNNRFTIGRDPSSQIVNVDFASNPTGGTNQVGAIRTYTDGVNLAEVMSFRKDGNIGIGTSSPILKTEIQSSASGDVQSIASSYWNLYLSSQYTSAGMKLGVNGGSTGAIIQGTQSPNGTIAYGLMLQPFGGNTTFGTLNDLNAKLAIRGSGSTSATTSLLVQSSSGDQIFKIKDDGSSDIGRSGANSLASFYGLTGLTCVIGNDSIQTPSNIYRTTNGQLTFYGRNNNANAFSFEHNNSQQSNASGVSMINIGGGYNTQNDAQFSSLQIVPSYDLNANTTTNSIARGIYYNPTITNLRVAQHRAIETTTGDVLLNTTSGNTLIGSGASNSAKLSIKGTGSTSATKSLLVQNSASQTALEVYDDKTSRFYNDVTINTSSGATCYFGVDINNTIRVSDTYAKFQIQRTGIGGAISLNGGGGAQCTYISNDNGHQFDFLGGYTQPDTFSINRQWFGNVVATTKNVLKITTSNSSTLFNAILMRGIYFAPTTTDWNEIRAFESTAGGAYFNTSSVDASAILQADSTTKGFLPPRMTDAEVRAIVSPAIGLMAYNTTLDCPVFYSAAGWRKVSHSVM